MVNQMINPLTRASRAMLQRLAHMGDRGLMQSQITSNGQAEFNKMCGLIWAGYAEAFGMDLQDGGERVPAVRITEAGKALLDQ